MRAVVGEHKIVDSELGNFLSKNLHSLEDYTEIWLSFTSYDPCVVHLFQKPVFARILDCKVFIVSVEKSVVAWL